MLPTSWNRGQAFIAVAGVRLEGNFAPALVSIRADRPAGSCGAGSWTRSAIACSARRSRSNGGSARAWQRVAGTRTDKLGNYVARAPVRGRYRVTATLGTVTVPSTSVGVR